MIIALAGNPNCGKTTLFNLLTGSRQHVGNFPGVTVEQKSGLVRGFSDVTAVDLPGIYSLYPYSPEEITARDYLLGERPDVIIDIIDAGAPERGLYLTLQLAELGIPMIAAFNMMDELSSDGGSVNFEQMSARLGIPSLPISASKNEGIDSLMKLAAAMAGKKPPKISYPESAPSVILDEIENIAARITFLPPRYAAILLTDGNLSETAHSIGLTDSETERVRLLREDMELLCGDCAEAVADMRYGFIEQLCEACIIKGQGKSKLRSERIDRLLTHRVWGIPIFIGIMLLIFRLTFSVIGAPLQALAEQLFGCGRDALGELLEQTGTVPWLKGLITEGICAGVGSVLSFLPTITVLFFFLSLLEDSGYMARAAFILDAPLRKIGLSGRSFVPLLIGFGCSVPAIMSAKTIPDKRMRWITVLVTPFISCGARLPVYAVITAAVFPKYGGAVIAGLYLLGIGAAALTGLIMKKESGGFIMELPTYRMPTARSVLLLMWEKAKDFAARAFTVILLSSVLIWLLESFDLRFGLVSDSGESILAALGSLAAPLFAPLGFGDWRACAALITGITAKESVVSTLTVLGADIGKMFTPLSAISFLVFILLYMPCAAAFAAMKKEIGLKRALLAVGYETAVAYIAALTVFQIGKLLF